MRLSLAEICSGDQHPDRPRSTAANNRGSLASFPDFGRPARTDRAPTLSRQRPIPPPLPTSPLDLPTNRRAMPPDRPRDLAIGLPPSDPHTNPLPLFERKPQPRMLRPPPEHQRLIPNPSDRLPRTPKPRRQPADRRALNQPLRDQPTLIRTQPPIQPTHPTSPHTTRKPDRVATTG